MFIFQESRPPLVQEKLNLCTSPMHSKIDEIEDEEVVCIKVENIEQNENNKHAGQSSSKVRQTEVGGSSKEEILTCKETNKYNGNNFISDGKSAKTLNDSGFCGSDDSFNTVTKTESAEEKEEKQEVVSPAQCNNNSQVDENLSITEEECKIDVSDKFEEIAKETTEKENDQSVLIQNVRDTSCGNQLAVTVEHGGSISPSIPEGNGSKSVPAKTVSVEEQNITLVTDDSQCHARNIESEDIIMCEIDPSYVETNNSVMSNNEETIDLDVKQEDSSGEG